VDWGTFISTGCGQGSRTASSRAARPIFAHGICELETRSCKRRVFLREALSAPARIAYPANMSHVLGYHVMINGVHRTFHDVKAVALAMAQDLKVKNPGEVVTMQCTETAQVWTVLPDGRVG